MKEKKNYDSTFCGSLPLHLVNHVQSYGVLVVLDKADLTVIQVSENIEAFTGLTAESFINQPFAGYITEAEAAGIRERFSTDITSKVPQLLHLQGSDKTHSFLAVMHARNDYLVLELEPVDENEGKGSSFIEVYQEAKYGMASINLAGTTKDICETAIAELKKISGFDKIMVYQFDEDWNGTVIAETMEEGMDSYLGLRFPASDIPKQARDLYFKNPYRLIPAVDYTPVKIVPVINPVTQAFIDLSNCNLRSVPQVHLEYLRNMNVMASMSTAIIKDDRLWGLISCHHRTPKYLSYEKCSLFELIAGVISARLSSVQNSEALQWHTSMQNVLAGLVKQVYESGNIITGVTGGEVTVLDILQCEGAVIVYNRRIETIGKTPSLAEVKDLLMWLQGNGQDSTFALSNLSAHFEEAFAYATIAAGAIILPVHRDKGEFIIGFRPEVIEKVNWGGNPNEAINFEKDNTKYHPRNSFALWQETVRHTAQPWRKEELAIAENFRNFVIEYTLKKVYELV